jgi:hypothetical protein
VGIAEGCMGRIVFQDGQREGGGNIINDGGGEKVRSRRC